MGCPRVNFNYGGDKDELEKRYRQFVHLCNAQVNALSPKTVEEVVDYMNKNEELIQREERSAAKSSAVVTALREGKVSSPSHAILTIIAFE